MSTTMTASPSSRARGSAHPSPEASKLVFVFLRGAQPKRKVALAVTDAMSWRAFIAQVERKLRLPGGSVTAVRYARGEAPVTSVQMLQDIDELEVESTASDAHGNGSAGADAATSRQAPTTTTTTTGSELSSRHAAVDVVADANENTANGNGANGVETEEEEDKYEKRRAGGVVGGLMRVLSPVRGAVAGRSKRPLLPTTNDVGGSAKQKGRQKRARSCSLLNLAMVAFMLTWVVGMYVFAMRKK